MNVARQILRVVFISITLLFVMLIFRQSHKAYFATNNDYIYAEGNAPEDVRSEVVGQLERFQAGYTARDLDQVDPFMAELFSEENLLVLGTMPSEIYIGHRDVSKLIYSDWNAWGDVEFLLDTAHVSAAGNVAWIATIGYVRFDVPRFLVLPLRLSAVMVKEDLGWKFQSMQFQFDLNLFFLFFVAILLTFGLTVSLISLLILIVRRFWKARRQAR